LSKIFLLLKREREREREREKENPYSSRTTTIITQLRGGVLNNPASYSEYPGFKSRTADPLS
jgi:hypothetical protein